jgi:hypothetical protein
MRLAWRLELNVSRSVISIRLFVLAVILGLATASSHGAAEETFETLAVGTNVYTKVTVLSKTRSDLFVSHSKGMGNIKVKDLEPSVQLRLGYQIEQPKAGKIEQIWQSTPLPALESDPRVQEFETTLVGPIAESIEQLDEQIAFAILGGLTSVYLLFSFLCRLICVKTGNPPSALIWLPFFKQIPLLKAAGMSPWWILTNFLPGVSLILYIAWCFNITHARAKHVIVALLLVLPVINLFAFLYLALADARSPGQAANRNVISLRSTSQRRAA